MRMQCASTTTKAKRASATRNEVGLGTGATARPSEAVKSPGDALKGTRSSYD